MTEQEREALLASGDRTHIVNSITENDILRKIIGNIDFSISKEHVAEIFKLAKDLEKLLENDFFDIFLHAVANLEIKVNLYDRSCLSERLLSEDEGDGICC